MAFSDAFLDALGRWQRGWRQDPKLKAPIAAGLEAEARNLPERFRAPRPECLYRKRHLYRSEDQRELVPLLLGGGLVENAPTSWSLDLAFAEGFDDILDEDDARAITGAVFRHVAVPGEVILDVPALWADPKFAKAVEAYRDRGGTEAQALFHFRGARDQNEVILRAPLLRTEILKLSGKGDFDAICLEMGAQTDEQREAVAHYLQAAGEVPETPRFLPAEASARVVAATIEKFWARLANLARIEPGA